MIIKDSYIGKLAFSFQGEALDSVVFLRENKPSSHASHPFVDLVLAYCQDASVDLSTIPFVREGTAHQQAVWDALRSIPKGEVRTYSELSLQVGGSPRSVANALRHNPLPILFPCHRVVAKSGIGGFSGETKGNMIAIKKQLLAIEGVMFG